MDYRLPWNGWQRCVELRCGTAEETGSPPSRPVPSLPNSSSSSWLYCTAVPRSRQRNFFWSEEEEEEEEKEKRNLAVARRPAFREKSLNCIKSTQFTNPFFFFPLFFCQSKSLLSVSRVYWTDTSLLFWFVTSASAEKKTKQSQPSLLFPLLSLLSLRFSFSLYIQFEALKNDLNLQNVNKKM